jgi:WD40 repeat protein
VNVRNVDWFEDARFGKDVIVEAHGDAIRSIAFSSDCEWMATASADATVKIWRTSDWQLQSTLIVLPDDENQPSDRTVALRHGVESSRSDSVCDDPIQP